MNIRLLPSGAVVLDEAEDFRRFAVLVPPGTEVAESPLAGLMRLERGYAWVPPVTVLALRGAADPGWRQGFDAMVAFAAGKGWTDGESRIRAHIEEA